MAVDFLKVDTNHALCGGKGDLRNDSMGISVGAEIQTRNDSTTNLDRRFNSWTTGRVEGKLLRKFRRKGQV